MGSVHLSGTDGRDDKRLDGVEIKVTFPRDQLDHAVEVLGLPDDRPRWQIYFSEDVAEGVATGTPLLESHIVLRARDRSGAKDDSTIKLRPCRRSQLRDHWLTARKEDDWELKVEADWAGTRRVLAASLTADRPDGLVAAVARGERRIEDLFCSSQVDFLRDCAGAHVNIGTLSLLPPVTATRWGTVDVVPLAMDVRAERWTVGDLDFLELSTVATLAEARATQNALVGHLTSLGLTVPSDDQTKTSQVLRLLVRQALGEA